MSASTSADAADLVVHAYGDPAAPTLVLLHGLTDSGPAWADAIGRWSPSYRVMAPDLLGHGASPRFTGAQLAAPDPMRAMYDALVRAVEALEASGPVVAIGHSMGGGLAAMLAFQRPDLVRAVVLEDPVWLDAPPWDDPQAETDQRLAETRAAAADLDAEVERGRREHPRWPPVELRPWAEATAAFDLPFGATGRAMLEVPWRDIAAGIAVPTLLVTGSHDVILEAPTRAAIADLDNPHLELAVVDGAGHCVRRDQTAAFHALVDPWLAALAGRAASARSRASVVAALVGRAASARSRASGVETP